MQWLKDLWNKILSRFGGGGSSFDKFAGPTKPFMGYGLVNNMCTKRRTEVI